MNNDEEDHAPHLPDAADESSSSSSADEEEEEMEFHDVAADESMVVTHSNVTKEINNTLEDKPAEEEKNEPETAAADLKQGPSEEEEEEVVLSSSSDDDDDSEDEDSPLKQPTTTPPTADQPKPDDKMRKQDIEDEEEKEDLVDASAQTINSGLKRSKPSSSTSEQHVVPKAKRRKSSSVNRLSPEEQRNEIIEKGKAELELEKKNIMDELPDKYKARLGEVVFAKFGKEWFASLILSPYDVAPGDTRDMWMAMFENTEERRDKMTYLVYYYGTTNQKEFYGFHPDSQIVSYEEGKKKGYHELSKAGQKKLAEGKALAKKDQDKKRAIDEMEEDLAKKPEERKRGVWPFQELYETERFIEVMLDETKASPSESDASSVPLDSSEDEDGKSPSPPKKKPSKKGRGRPPKKNKAQAPPSPDAPISPTKDAEMEDIGDAEVSSGGDDQKDDDVEPSSSSDDDMDDADYVTEGKKKAGRPKKPPSEKKPKEKAAKPEKKQLQRKRTTTKGKKAKLAEERDRYLESLDKCMTPLRSLVDAVRKEKDATKTEAAMKELLGLVESMAGTFIQQSGVVSVVKEAKKLLKSQNADLSTYKQLFELLKTTHEKKKDQIPDVADLKKLTDKWRTPKKERREPAAKEETAATPSKAKPEQKTGTPVTKQEPAPRTEPPKTAPSKPSTDGSRSLSQTSTGSAPKTEKKAFSLGSFVRPSKASVSKDEKTAAQGPRVKDPRLSIEKTKALPQWLTSPPDDDADFASNQDRTFAIEFVQGAASQLPSDKVNKDYFSRALEAAIYKWAKEKITLSWQDDYWLKVHSIVGAICGKRKPGTLAKQIVAGEFDSAKAIVELDDDALFRSFEDQQ